MAHETPTIRLHNVSRWYGEVLGVNKIDVEILPGITGLVGPNGSGKSTLMNLICGLLRPGQGSVTVLGEAAWNNPKLQRRLGYCTQVDSFYEHATGLQFVRWLLALHGRGKEWTERTAREALARLHLTESQDRQIRTYSKGMRQRVKVALALAHQPEVLVLDEPFNGLDPQGRRAMMQTFADYAREGRTLLVSSHILHEVGEMTDRILMMSNGYAMAEGDVRHVRDQLRSHPFQVIIRCNAPRRLAAMMLDEPSVLSVAFESHDSMTVATNAPDAFYLRLNDIILQDGIRVDMVTLADENVQSIYRYLSGKEHH